MSKQVLSGEALVAEPVGNTNVDRGERVGEVGQREVEEEVI